MRNDDDNYYGYNDYGSDTLYLLEQPASRPVGDAVVWLKHLLVLLGGKLPQWVLTTVLMFISIMVMVIGLGLVLDALGFEAALKQKEAWVFVVMIVGVLFINMLPLFFMAGFVSIVAGVAEEGKFAFGRLFAGFGDPMLQLIKLFLFWFLVSFALGLLAGIAGIKGGWPVLLVVLLFLLCNWMALPLIVLQGVSPLDAIWMSLVGSLKNILPQGGFVLAMLAVLLGVSFLAVDGLRLLAQGGSWVSLLLLLVFYTVLCTVFPIIGYMSYRNIWTSAPLE